MIRRKKIYPVMLVMVLLLSGCANRISDSDKTNNTNSNTAVTSTSSNISDTASSQTQSNSSVSAINIDPSEMFSNRDYEVGYDESESAAIYLDDTTASCDSDAVQISGTTITITDEGTYILSGTLEDGSIVVNAENTDKLQLVLDNVSIQSKSSAPIYILQADKVFLTLATDSVNTLSNGGEFIAVDDNNIDSVIFSKEDLTLNGSGSLTIESPAGHGIVSKDDLVITSGNYNITASSHGLSGKDSIRIADGNFTIASGKDGIHAQNTEDSSLGFLYLLGGKFELTAQGDGLSANGYLQAEDGTFHILTGSGSIAASQTQQSTQNGRAFEGRATTITPPQTTTTAATEDATSAKGIKAAGDLLLNGGTFTIDSADDSLHTNGNLFINGGTYQLSTGDDGLHADAKVVINAGTISILKSYEGIEGLSIDILGGNISLVSSDDGLNAAGGNDQSGFGGQRGKDNFASNSDSYITISGGTLKINAAGDGIDSNGSLSVSGGETYVSGPSDGANGALDYDTNAIITGGVFLAAGSSQMAQSFSSSTQGVLMVSAGAQAAGSTIELTNSNGQVIVFWQTDKTFDCVLISCPELIQGSTYTLNAGTNTTQITMDSLLYSSGNINNMNNREGMDGMGRNQHNKPESAQ